MAREEWDPRGEPDFWRNVAKTAGLPSAAVLGPIFAPGAALAATIGHIAKMTPDLFKIQEQIEAENADKWARAQLRGALIRSHMSSTKAQVATWMRVVRAYYELTAPNKHLEQ